MAADVATIPLYSLLDRLPLGISTILPGLGPSKESRQASSGKWCRASRTPPRNPRLPRLRTHKSIISFEQIYHLDWA
jgi:hypothetical protein